MIPVVAHTTALRGERPIANAFGTDVSAIAIRGLGRSACTHSRPIMPVKVRRLKRRDLTCAHRPQRKLRISIGEQP